MELWITFSSGGKELVAYTVEGTFAGGGRCHAEKHRGGARHPAG